MVDISLENKNCKLTSEQIYEEAFQKTGHGRYNYLVLLACSVIINAVALDMFGFSVVIAASSCDLQLSIAQTGILAAAPFIGILFAYPWGYFADTRGRRRALLLSTSVGFVFGVLCSLSIDWRMMLALKIIGCAFSTASFTLSMTYLGENTASRYRDRYLFIINGMNLSSEIVSFGLAYLILPISLGVTIPWLSITFTSWRLFSLTLTLPLGVSAILLTFLYESPKFLASKGEEEKALRVMENIYIMNGGTKGQFPMKSLEVMKNSETNVKISFWGSIGRQTLPLFTPPRLWRTIQLFFLISLVCAINNVFVMWFPTMLDIYFKSVSSNEETGFCDNIKSAARNHEAGNSTLSCQQPITDNTLYSGILTGLFFTILNLFAAAIASWRRSTLIAAFSVAFISCIMVCVLKTPLASVIFFALIQTTAIGIGSIASYFVDLYPTSYRGLATSLGFMVARMTTFTGVVVVGSTIVQHCQFVFYLSAALSLSGICVTMFLP
ncbi:unnamed protein product [Leptidea sinapis]|uniref:Major facilitator superfamily (MFS) profile domain-containing protein n=1 Tax=Leptidea sinapis TaxID=189913 RepID=A0A5E4R600_9NEOP|nr:unnamed protein product [Leptidea sinapis]